jgi:hypothetical protein
LFCSWDTAWSWYFGCAHIRNIHTCECSWEWHWCTTSHTVRYLYSCLSSCCYLLSVRPCLPRAGYRWTHRT